MRKRPESATRACDEATEEVESDDQEVDCDMTIPKLKGEEREGVVGSGVKCEELVDFAE